MTELLLRFRREEMATTDTHNTAITSAAAAGDSFSSSSLPAVPPVKYILGEGELTHRGGWMGTHASVYVYVRGCGGCVVGSASAADAAAGVVSGKRDGEGSKGEESPHDAVSVHLCVYLTPCVCMSGVCEIDYLVLIDRRVDLITPLCSQFTYEGTQPFQQTHTHPYVITWCLLRIHRSAGRRLQHPPQ